MERSALISPMSYCPCNFLPLLYVVLPGALYPLLKIVFELGQTFRGLSQRAVSWPRFWLVELSCCQNACIHATDKWMSALTGGPRAAPWPNLSLSAPWRAGPALHWEVQTHNPFPSKGNPCPGVQPQCILLLATRWDLCLLPLGFWFHGTGGKISLGPTVFRPLAVRLCWDTAPYLLLGHKTLSPRCWACPPALFCLIIRIAKAFWLRSDPLVASSILRIVPRKPWGEPLLEMMVILIYFWALLGWRTFMTFDNLMALCLWGSGTKPKGRRAPKGSVAAAVGEKKSLNTNNVTQRRVLAGRKEAYWSKSALFHVFLLFWHFMFREHSLVL